MVCTDRSPSPRSATPARFAACSSASSRSTLASRSPRCTSRAMPVMPHVPSIHASRSNSAATSFSLILRPPGAPGVQIDPRLPATWDTGSRGCSSGVVGDGGLDTERALLQQRDDRLQVALTGATLHLGRVGHELVHLDLLAFLVRGVGGQAEPADEVVHRPVL